VPESEIANDVLALLQDRVRSLDGLELLLALRSASPGDRNVDELVTRLRLPKGSVEEVLPALRDAGLLAEHDGRWSFDPAEAIASSVDALAEVYEQRPAMVMRVLNRLALRRGRSDAATAFANAFVFGKHRRKGDG
jgi:DNA-binding IclR family transcriptional regulator